ncbi:acetate kinase [Polynucleobacter tropicus]|uniref:Acetate kinase n=2 Tax=Polynucleobacter tropicus TaxID=1743174 RepID=A0A6M9Q1N6_9BURK|nr:acetate kinase [Polynucleobacter tropicus]
MAILSVNAGSSTLKFALYPVDQGAVQPSVLVGSYEGLEPNGAPMLKYGYEGEIRSVPLDCLSREPFACALSQLKNLVLTLPNIPKIQAIAHRIVHGGSLFTQSVISTTSILKELSKLNVLAPLHQPHNIEGVRAFANAFPDIPQVLCFDTAYHKTVSSIESAFALPAEITSQGVRRYGFHGLSYQYIIGTLLDCTKRAQGRVMMAHLGNGASLCAAIGGKSIATTMGFSALDGLMMGTRAGSLDAGVLLYLLDKGLTPEQLEKLLYKKSGLLGVSGISADMRKLRASKEPLAIVAIDLFTHRVVREAGAMVACLEGLDVIAFSGGIGEHDSRLRQSVCEKLSWLGIKLDETLNQAATNDAISKISAEDSAIEVWVIPTDEGLVAARDAQALLAQR